MTILVDSSCFCSLSPRKPHLSNSSSLQFNQKKKKPSRSVASDLQPFVLSVIKISFPFL